MPLPIKNVQIPEGAVVDQNALAEHNRILSTQFDQTQTPRPTGN